MLPKSPNHTSPLITFPHSLSSNSCWSCFPGDHRHRRTPVPAAYAESRDLYSWQLGMLLEARAHVSQKRTRDRAVPVSGPWKNSRRADASKGGTAAFPPQASHPASHRSIWPNRQGTSGILTPCPPGPHRPAHARRACPKSTVPSRLLPRSSTCGRGQAHFSRRRVRRSKNSRQNCAAGPWYPLRRPQ